MIDTVHVLAVAAALSAGAVSLLAWRVGGADHSQPDRLVGELRVARWAAVLLAAVGAISIGLAVGETSPALGITDAALGTIFVGMAGIVLQREPREGLILSAGAFVVHALLCIAHRPGWLPVDIAPRWFIVGCAVYDVYIAGVCYWTQRR